MKVIKALGRTFWTIISIVLLLVAVLCVLLLSPQVVSRAEITIVTMTALGIVTVTFPTFSGIFGGNVEFTLTTEFYRNGEQVTDPIVSTGQFQLNFDYFALIGVVLGVIGVLIAIIFYRKKALLGVSSLFTLASAVILGCQGLTFSFVNPDIATLVEQGTIEGLLETSCFSVGGIIFAICMGILFLMSLVRFFLAKSKSSK